MESSPLDPTKDDLPLRSNTNHMLVRHYVLDLTVYFQRKVIGGSIVLFLEPVKVSSQNIISDSNPLSPSSKSAESNPEIPSGDPLVSEEFTLVLDCCDLEVSRVDEVDVTAALAQLNKNPQHPSSSLVERLISMSPSCWKRQHELYLQCSSSPSVQTSRPLRFHTDRWSLQISKSGVCSPQDFPCVLRVWYETKISGGSVRWTKDQDGRCCVYTMGSPINNRALFPCQEPPVAMSTWQAQVRSPCDYTVLMSGENEASPEPAEEGFCQWKYYVTMPMPASTFTIAVGQWLKVDNTEDQCVRNICLDSKSTEHQEKSSSTLNVCEREDDQQDVCSHVDYPCRFTTSVASKQTVIPHRVFAPPCHLKKAKEMVLPLLPLCLSAAHSILGVHPFSRLDVLIVPAGFSSLGMASPHMVFLSQSVLTGQRSLCGARLCHEIAHSWFGLVIGARDWTEEWISEGFATYLEDFFWTQVLQLGHREAEEQRCVKALLRWRRLSDEVKNSEEELQVLRPNKENTGEVSASGASIVKHALNPEKPFMQVHYLKGYFLLKFLAGQVGEENFLHFFKVFVRRFHGQLILSQMFLDTFPGVSSRGVSLESILTDWLDTPQLPKWLKSVSSEWLETPAVRGVKDEVGKWIHFSGTCGKGSKRKRTEPKVNFRKLNAEELVLLLEYLLDEAKLTLPTLKHLHTEYNLQEQDAEVKHRWCELVVKHKHTSAYPDLELFLVHHQAMGVYLYGELMVQEDARQQALARRCLDIVRDNMDQSARSVVEEMVL